MNQEIAGRLISTIFIISTILCPTVGLLVDKIGNRISLLFLASSFSIMAYLNFFNLYPLVPLTFLGLSYAIVGAVAWSTLVYLTPKNQIVSTNLL